MKPPFIEIEDRRVSEADPLYIIAEIGTAHGGDRQKALDLLQATKEAGADCAKFQVVIAQEILHPLTGSVPLPGGEIPLFDRFRQLEQRDDFYAFLKEETEALGLRFLASPFGPESAKLLHTLGSSAYKVASPELNYIPLLIQLAAYGKPLILSTGVSRLSDIERALEASAPAPRALLHCITAYPAPEREYNLRILPHLSGIFGVPVGVSDHSLDPLAVPLVSLLQGSALLEKHICLDKKTDGLDDPIAQEPTQFSSMVKEIRFHESLKGEDRKKAVEEKIGPDLVEGILGTGIKVLAPAEAANYSRTNRSIHVLRSLAAGHKLEAKDLGFLRTEKILRPGLHPDELSRVLGKILSRSVDDGQGLIWEDLLQEE